MVDIEEAPRSSGVQAHCAAAPRCDVGCCESELTLTDDVSRTKRSVEIVVRSGV